MVDIFDTRFEGKDVELEGSFAELGDDINIIEKDPTLKKIVIGAGWDVNAFNAATLDMDLSIFMVNKDLMTREDEDFVFYNQKETLEGGVKHLGDSRTGAGDGDDECISVDLQSLPFEIMHLMVVLSIYKGFEKEQNIGMVKNAYIRVVNEETGIEIVRFKLDEHLKDKEDIAVIAVALNREGPKWHFKPLMEHYPEGLSEIATKYGCVINQQ